jgi:hypothetical protein
MVYLADVGQRKRDEKASNKGRGLKIGHDHKLASYLEQKIGKEKWSPDAAIGSIKAQGSTLFITTLLHCNIANKFIVNCPGNVSTLV